MAEELKKQVESVLFSAGKRIQLEEIARLVRSRDLDAVLKCLEELRTDYEQKASSLIIVQDDTSWKLTVREPYLPLVRKIITQTELTKSVMETLAVIAFKTPVLQSHIIKVRTNKAYDHLNELENSGYITRIKQGRTKLIRLGKKFFDYFDVAEDKVKERFKTVEEMEKVILQGEQALVARKQEIKQELEKAQQMNEEEKQKREQEIVRLDREIAALPEIDLVDEQGEKEKLEVYQSETQTEIAKEPLPDLEKATDTVDGMEVYSAPEITDEKPKRHKKHHKTAEKIEEKPTPEEQVTEKPEKEETSETEVKEVEEKTEEKPRKEPVREFGGKGLFPEGVPKEVEEQVDRRVEQLMKGEKDETPPEMP